MAADIGIMGPEDTACLNLRWALALLDGLLSTGLEHLVLSPGSRSTPVVLAAQLQAEAGARLTLTPILDERSAAFFSLGLARAARRPVALLCTSGSAPGHWLPAVIEASEWGLPLVLLSADRPPQLRGWGANQTIDQTRLFGPFAREFHDPGPPQPGPAALKAMRALGRRAAAVALGPRPGPVHINLPFPEPLVPTADCPALEPDQVQDGPVPAGGWSLPEHSTLPPLPPGRGLIVCGPGDLGRYAGDLWACARALHLPVLADPLSGLRFGGDGPGRIARYDALLRNAAAATALRPDWVLRLGAAPVSKALADWLDGIPALRLDPAGGWADPTHDAFALVVADPGALLHHLAGAGLVHPDPEWLALWTRAEARVGKLAESHLSGAPWCEAHLIRDLMELLPAGDGLLCANSLPIRQLDTWSGTRAAPLEVFGNRGASGIDGQASTLAGLNAAGVPTLGLLGDLSLVHDLSGLLLGHRLHRPLVVLNNGGGRIFDYLPQHGLPGFEALWRTPQALDLAALAGALDLSHRRVADGEGFRRALTQGMGAPGPGLIEVLLDAEASRAMHLGFWGLVAQANLIPNG
jgi:2-succinyl-5-enolpyruvyl-6-hydroxy-3-cyclohexene-1-carboxylate synthase